jgi:hypothetical protein
MASLIGSNLLSRRTGFPAQTLLCGIGDFNASSPSAKLVIGTAPLLTQSRK